MNSSFLSCDLWFNLYSTLSRIYFGEDKVNTLRISILMSHGSHQCWVKHFKDHFQRCYLCGKTVIRKTKRRWICFAIFVHFFTKTRSVSTWEILRSSWLKAIKNNIKKTHKLWKQTMVKYKLVIVSLFYIFYSFFHKNDSMSPTLFLYTHIINLLSSGYINHFCLTLKCYFL